MKRKVELTKSIENIIYTENYKLIHKKLPVQTSDRVLENNNMFRIKAFLCSIGDCLLTLSSSLNNVCIVRTEIQNEKDSATDQSFKEYFLPVKGWNLSASSLCFSLFCAATFPDSIASAWV